MSSWTRNAVTSTLVDLLPILGADAHPDRQQLSAAAQQQVRDRICSPDFDAWSQALASVGNCARPIRLHGRSCTVDRATGEVLSSYRSDQEPLGVTHVRCGNRRASTCPSCSRLYAADMFHLIRSGVSGGKTVPAAVADNPLVFATVTAPSFGAVHGRRVSSRACHRTLQLPLAARTAARGSATPHTPRTTRAWGSPCAETATTTTPRWCGSGGRRTCSAASPSRCAAWSRPTSTSPPAG